MKKNSDLQEKLSINKTDDIPQDVIERLAAQERILIIQRDKERIRSQHNLDMGKESAPEGDPGSIEVLHDLLNDDEDNDADSYFDHILKDEDNDSGMELIKDSNTNNFGMKSNFMLEEGKALPTLKDYLENMCVDPNIRWTQRMTQTATVLIEMEHPRRRDPNMRSLILSVLRRKNENGQEYNCGDWVEILAPDMSWTLETITKVHDILDENENKIYLYNAGQQRRLSPYDMRVPEEGLLRIFGSRPWIWQQWALIKLEQRLRFQENHMEDFETFNIPLFVRDLWFQWLGAEANHDFRKHLSDERINICQDDLFDHIMKPFYILDDMRRSDGWEYDSDEFSIFTYLSLHGSGFSVCLISLLLQIVIPYVVMASTVIELDENFQYLALDKKLEAIFCVTDDNVQCHNLVLTTFLVVCIQVIYITKVVPDMACTFQDVAGVGGYGSEKSYARCKSIRKEVFSENNDRFGQILGSMTDMYMNTLYIYILFFINLVNILNEANPTDVILNALALEFVFKIDEVYATASWWDPGRRWLKAGIMEVFIQSTFQFRALQSARLFSDLYDIEERAVEKACKGDKFLLHNADVARKDRDDPQYMNHSERYEFYCRRKAAELNNQYFDEFTKPCVMFGKPEQILFDFLSKFYENLGVFDGFGVFYRLQQYQTWSRWNKVLYLGKIPNVNDLFEINALGKPIVKKTLEREKVGKDGSLFKNFNKKPVVPSKRFAEGRRQILSFQELRKSLRFAIYQKRFSRALLALFDGVLRWLSYAVQVMFPVMNLFLFVFAFYCYEQKISGELRNEEEGLTRCNCKSVYVPYSRDILECDVQVAYAMYSRREKYDPFIHGKQFKCNVLLETIADGNYTMTAVQESVIDYISSYAANFSDNVDIVCEENYTLTQCISEYSTDEEVKDCVESE